jgi:hypothetical protein
MYKNDSQIIRILWIILSLSVALLLWYSYTVDNEMEQFSNSSDIYEKVIDLYYNNLERQPTSDELKTHSNAILNGDYNFDELYMRLINSDEYKRLIKTQDNSILPETKRMIEEKDILIVLRSIYNKIKHRPMSSTLQLVIRDIYVYYDFNIYKLVTLLRDDKYDAYEKELLAEKNLTKEYVILLLNTKFDNTKITYDADKLEKIDKMLPINKRMIYLEPEESVKVQIDDKSIDTGLVLDYLKDNRKKITIIQEPKRVNKYVVGYGKQPQYTYVYKKQVVEII